MVDLFTGYGATTNSRKRTGSGSAWDEMFPDPSSLTPTETRAAYKDVYGALARMTQEELRGRTAALTSSYLAQGVTFDFAGEERPFPLDAVQRVIEQPEWVTVEAGIKQRVLALEAFLADIYGPQAAVHDGVIPASLISSSNHFHRQAAGIVSANNVRIQVSGIDLIRDEKGAWRVLEDNVRVPSGVSYVISNRRVMAQTLPELFVSMRVRPVGDYPNKLLQALRASAPAGVDDPNVVVLTPGVFNSACFEHTLLARLMGVELVEGRDLFWQCHDRQRGRERGCGRQARLHLPARSHPLLPRRRSDHPERRYLAARGSPRARGNARPARRARGQARRRVRWQGARRGARRVDHSPQDKPLGTSDQQE